MKWSLFISRRSVDLCLSKLCNCRSFHEMLRMGQMARGTLAICVVLNISWNDLFSSLEGVYDLCLSKLCNCRSFHEMLRTGQMARGTLAICVVLNISWNDLFSSLEGVYDLCLSKLCNCRSFHEMLRTGQMQGGALHSESPKWQGGPHLCRLLTSHEMISFHL